MTVRLALRPVSQEVGGVHQPAPAVHEQRLRATGCDAWLEVIARADPLTYAITAMRHLVMHGFEVGVATNIGLLALFSAACLAVGVYQFGRNTAERVS